MKRGVIITLIILLVLASLYCAIAIFPWAFGDDIDNMKQPTITNTIDTEYGDTFTHKYRFKISFPSAYYEHHIEYNNEELFTFDTNDDTSDITITGIYNESWVAYKINYFLVFRKRGDASFEYDHILSLDFSRQELYPIYQALLLKNTESTHFGYLARELLYSGDTYTKSLLKSYAEGNFSPTENAGVYIGENEKKELQRISSRLLEGYSISWE
jgi:hypothetical protein